MMELSSLSLIKTLLNSHSQTTEDIFKKVVEKIGKALNVDRCFLCIRDPSKDVYKIPFLWRRNDTIPGDILLLTWVEESSIVDDDPLYKAALACKPSIYITDIETASPGVLNREFEDRYFKHRAFIHGHIVTDGQLWGTLEPCVFDHPRQWIESETTFIEDLLPLLAVRVKEFVTKEQTI